MKPTEFDRRVFIKAMTAAFGALGLFGCGGAQPADTTAPSVPTNLTGTAASVTAINLTWTASTDNVGVTGYRVYRNGTQVNTAATNSYTDTGLTASSRYTYTVAAYDAAGNVSAQCTAVSVTTLATANGTASYYVTKTGDDNNPGTQTAPWLTIQKAADSVAAGDTVNIAPGTYTEMVNISKNGTPSSPIIWTGTGTVTVTQLLVGGSYNTFTNFTLIGPSGMYVGCIEFPGNQTGNTFSYITYSGTSTITDGCGVIRGIYAPTNCTFDHFTVNQPNSHLVQIGGSGHTFSNFFVRSTNGWDIFRMNFSNSVIRDCDISVSNPGDANTNHCDIFQAFNDSGNELSQNNVIENNYIHDCPNYQFAMVSDDQENGAIGGWTIRNNVVADVQMTFNLYAPDFTFTNNTFVRVGYTSGWAIIYNSTTAGHANNLTFKNNIFYQCGYPTNASMGWFAGDAVTGLVHDYNLVIGTGTGLTKTGFTEPNGINGTDPMFIDPAAGNYSLQSGSPAVGMGVLTKSPNT